MTGAVEKRKSKSWQGRYNKGAETRKLAMGAQEGLTEIVIFKQRFERG